MIVQVSQQDATQDWRAGRDDDTEESPEYRQRRGALFDVLLDIASTKDGKGIDARSLGHYLSKNADKVNGDLRLERAGEQKRATRWRVRKLTLIRKQLEDCLPEILATLKEQALGGDLAAIKLLLERTLPPLRSSLPAVALPVEDGSLTERGDAILAAMARGELSPDAGNAMLGALATQIKLIEATELTDRIERLESVLQQQQNR